MTGIFNRLFRVKVVLLGLALMLTMAVIACGGSATPTPAPAPAPAIDEAALSDLRKAIDDLATSQPEGLTAAQVQSIVNDAVGDIDSPESLTAAQVQSIVGEAIAAIETPEGLTVEQVEAIVARAAPQGLSASQVRDIVGTALETVETPEGLTAAEVEAIVTSALEEGTMEAEPFTIGIMDSLTGPGETYGNLIVRAKQMAADEINAAGGINGRMLRLAIEDSKCGAADAITAYNKLTDVDGVKIILGTSCSGAMLGAAPLAEADGVVLFSASATNPDIANAGDYIFRTAINDLNLGIDTGNLLWGDGIRTLATITEGTDYAEGVRRTTVEQFEKRGGSVVASESYSSDVIDFRSQITKLIAENPDAIHLAVQTEASGGTIMKQARELGYDGPLYSEVVPVGATSLEVAGEGATGLKAVIPELDPANPKATELLANFRERYGYISLAWFMGSGYDTVYIAAACLRRTGDDQDADGFRDCLYNTTWDGTIGTGYSFDSDGEVIGLSNAVVQVLPVAERTEANQGYRVLGQAPRE